MTEAIGRTTAPRGGRRLGRVRGRAAVGALVLLVGAGCGDDAGTDGAGTDQESPTQAWAGDVCAAVVQWRGELAGAVSTLSDPMNLSAADVEKSVSDVQVATQDLGRDLKSLGAPDTDAGQQARRDLTALSSELSAQRGVVADALDQAPAGRQETRDQVATVTGALSRMLSEVRQTLDELRKLDGAEELTQAFEDAPECADLRQDAGNGG